GGSVLSADAELVSKVFVTTSLAAASGVLSAVTVSWIFQRKPDLTMALNGSLAGLVGVTAGADVVSVMDSVLIGILSGVIVVFGVSLFDKLKLDDPVGALSVHLLCGIWGTLAVGIFSPETASLGVQLLGVVSYGAVSFLSALLLFAILKYTIGIRVSEEEELGGLDIGEHGMEAYNGFQIFITQ
ncbi:MAG: ammonium transporter, partial [Kiritimatiellia bacterium]